ncbi:MAG: hypothetical protein JWN04_6049 [Myxococcaceae bacterium]|nr:hypothetical protein [Myxococcaceae bacterium]
MVKRFVVFGVLLLLALFVYLQSRSSTYRVERSVHIAALPSAVYERLIDLHQWPRWSPWGALDPELKSRFGGAERGQGATYAWDGNAQVGRGRITIREARPSSQVVYGVTFEAPLESEMSYEFRLLPDQDGARLTWSFVGEHPFWARFFALFRDLDAPVGADMQRGLEQLAAQLEAR